MIVWVYFEWRPIVWIDLFIWQAYEKKKIDRWREGEVDFCKLHFEINFLNPECLEATYSNKEFVLFVFSVISEILVGSCVFFILSLNVVWIKHTVEKNTHCRRHWHICISNYLDQFFAFYNYFFLWFTWLYGDSIQWKKTIYLKSLLIDKNRDRWRTLVSAVMNLRVPWNVEHLQNDMDRRKPKYSEKTLLQNHFAHHKFHMDWSGIESRLPP